jgi:saccharopine dehydrogenase-like NADP-dependent oxidoreductase
MRNILVLGAGRSSSALIKYLLDHAILCDWLVILGDISLSAAVDKLGDHPRGRALKFDISDESANQIIASSDVVISLLPASFHPLVAARCLAHRRHLLTASYVSDEMKSFHDEAVSKDLLFLNECGLDPGIDHMSAMQVIGRIQFEGGKLTSFESFTGGLIAPETDPDNPWRYKFTWNPRNVVMAGQSTAKYLQEGNYKYIPYQQLFKRVTQVSVPGLGEFEGYANRDSLSYIETYNLRDINTMLRGTLRNKGFCTAWDIFVQLGCCDDTYEMNGVDKMTHATFLDSFLDDRSGRSTIEKIKSTFNLTDSAHALNALRWSGFMEEDSVGLAKGTPAQILEHILNKKWRLNTSDKDQIVMWHRFTYEMQGTKKVIQSSLVVTGSDSVYTAMAKTVGLPLAIAAKLLMQGKITSRGVQIPISRQFYEPILKELELSGVVFNEI